MSDLEIKRKMLDKYKHLMKPAPRNKGEELGEYSDSFDDGHLGGANLKGDPATYSLHNTWGYLVDKYKIQSILDVGCGFGYAMREMKKTGVEVFGVEGSSKIVENSFFPNDICCHDYETKILYKFMPGGETYDLGWSTEFVEHVSHKASSNFLKTFQCCKRVCFTYAYVGQQGHNHVNENTPEYWIDRMDEHGFDFSIEETEAVKEKARIDKELIKGDNPEIPDWAYHVCERALFFENRDKKFRPLF